MSRGGRWALVALVAMFSLAAAYGMRADLPFSRFATEEEQVFYAVKFGSGDLNPHYFLHPPFFAYGLCGLYGVSFVVGRVLGYVHSVADFERLFFTDPTVFFLIARIAVLGLGALGLLLFYRLSLRLYKQELVALLAVGFLAVSPQHVIAAHYANTDIPVMVVAFLALMAITRVLQTGAMSSYLMAGGLIGLATATKYNAAWLGVALLMAHVIRTVSAKAPWRAVVCSPRLLAGMGVIVVGFIMGCPYALLDFPTFISSYRKLTWELMTPEYHFASYRVQGLSYLFLIKEVFARSLGVPLMVVSAIGLCYALWRQQPEDLLLSGFFLTFAAYVGSWDIIKPRYFIFTFPLALLLAARWCVALVDRLPRASIRTAILAGVWAILSIAPVRGIVQFNRLVAQTPAPVRARVWIEQHVPPGTGVAAFAGVPLIPNEVSIQRQLEEIHTKRLGQGIRLQRLLRYVNSLPATYDVWPLPFPWREDFDEADFNFEQHGQAGVKYFLVTQEIEHYLADPTRYPKQVAYYEAIMRACQLVQVFRQPSPMVDTGLGAEEYVLIYEFRTG